MIKHILEHLSDPLRAEDIAKVVGLHPNYALNLFTSVMNVSLHKFVVRMRLSRARSLLFEGELAIENVAFSSGFTALSQVYEQFRNAYGMTPREMRANYLHQGCARTSQACKQHEIACQQGRQSVGENCVPQNYAIL